MLNLGIRDLNSRLTLIGGILLGTALGGLEILAGRHCVVLQPRKQGMHVNSHGYPMLCRHGRTGKSDKHQRPKSIRNATTTRQSLLLGGSLRLVIVCFCMLNWAHKDKEGARPIADHMRKLVLVNDPIACLDADIVH